jgi:PAS domain S-box-containing protein
MNEPTTNQSSTGGGTPARPPAFDELIVAAATCGILVYDATGQCRRTNEAAAEITGGTLAGLLAQNFRRLQSWTDSGMRRVADEVLADGKARAGEFHSVTTFGRDMWVACRFSRFEQDGHPHLLLIVTDVTERKSLEEQFRQAQKMESVGRLAGGVAHDFNNLLTIISGYSELMLSETPPGHPLRDYLMEIKKAGERATILTRKLLAYSRRQILAPDVLDVNALVQDAESMLKRVLGEDVEFVTVPGADLGLTRVDAGQLEQSLMNLAINARDAMPRGGRFTIETATVNLDEDYAHTHPEVKPGPYVRLTVTDTGCGMDEATLAHVFEPFFTTKEPGKGTGLGLAMVFGFVKQSGGQVTALSQPGRGSTFQLYFPRVETPAPAAETRADGDAPPHRGETILLVEDEEDLRKLALELLTQHGYTVLEAPDGLAALRLAEAYPGAIDLLVSDVVMPGMDGRQLAGRLAALRPAIKTLFMSGYTDDTVLRHDILTAETSFLQKPFSVAALPQKVRQVLAK